VTHGLYFVELTVADWRAARAWYRDALGLAVELEDEATGFVLLRAGGSRVALKAGTPRPGTVKLVFEVADLAAGLDRLAGLGAAVGPVKPSAEGYRRAFVRDPDGYEIGLFEWVR
jgi:catechol 2,3-dioxygenase-like lactoylglutathione lyase family enzyme